jgi:hypothetical protein
MADPDGLDALRDVLDVHLRTTREFAQVTPECLDDDTVAAFAEGTLPADIRAASLTHLASCARCLRAVASVAHTTRERPVARELSALAGSGRRRLIRYGVPALAAAAVVTLLVWHPRPTDGSGPHRAPTITAGSVPVLVAPTGAVTDARTLQWTAVAGADRYRVTLFAASGSTLYETELTDTMAVLPDSVPLAHQQPYLWKVEARIGWDRWSTSSLAEFRLVGAGDR